MISREPQVPPDNADHFVGLLSIFGAQYASYTTLLWQVPALSLTAQAFLLTIALNHGNGETAKVVASALSMVIALASYLLMHDQRGHAINNGELAKRLSEHLTLGQLLGTVRENDSVPAQTNAEDIWTWHGEDYYIKITGAGRTYAIWQACMLLFFFVGTGIIASAFVPLTAAVLIAVGLGILGVLTAVRIELTHRKAEAKNGHPGSSG
jgi:hypothetical protein